MLLKLQQYGFSWPSLASKVMLSVYHERFSEAVVGKDDGGATDGCDEAVISSQLVRPFPLGPGPRVLQLGSDFQILKLVELPS